MKFNSVLEIVEDLKKGRAVIVIDDESRENEGDLVVASSFITPEMINFMSREAGGLICVSLTEDQVSRLELPLMVDEGKNLSSNKTAFTISVEAREGVSTGISARDRAQTVRVVSNPNSSKEDIVSPGHIFPIQAQRGGVLKRAGHTEASVDFCRLAGLNPSGVICEIINPDGTMARTKELLHFAKKHQLKIGTIEDLIDYLIANESFVDEIARTQFFNQYVEGFEVCIFKDKIYNTEHLAFVKGEISPEKPCLVRVHSSSILGDVFGVMDNDGGTYLRKSFEMINQEGGVLVYLTMRHTLSALVGLHKHSKGKDLPPLDVKDYGVGAQILRTLGVTKIRLITNSTKKRVGLKGYGLNIEELVRLDTKGNLKLIRKES